MAVSSALIRAAISQIAGIDGASMSREALVEDVVLLAKVWPDEEDFAAAVASTVRAISQVSVGKTTPDALRGKLDGWYSYHYQLRRKQGEPAIMRVVFRRADKLVEIMGFGHRFKPASIYHRIVLDSDKRGVE